MKLNMMNGIYLNGMIRCRSHAASRAAFEFKLQRYSNYVAGHITELNFNLPYNHSKLCN